MAPKKKALLINYLWRHAVNDQSRLDEVMNEWSSSTKENDSRLRDVDDDATERSNDDVVFVDAIEADIIHSETTSSAVMGHPPSTHGDLTLASFLRQIRRANFQHGRTTTMNADERDDDDYRCPVIKLDFKSANALESGLADVKDYLDSLPTRFHRRVWINADILPGPGEERGKSCPKFVAVDFLLTVTAQLPSTVLSVGWTTSLADVRAAYTDEMVSEMMECVAPYSDVEFTFPVRASCFVESWKSLKRLYHANERWTLTIWWGEELPNEKYERMYKILERNGEFGNRTYYDLPPGFRCYLSERDATMIVG